MSKLSRAFWRRGIRLTASALVLASAAGFAHAQSLPEALARAYTANPNLNAARAALRVTNENVPQALSGYRPRVTASADAGHQGSYGTPAGGAYGGSTNSPRGFGVQADQLLWNGSRVENQVGAAEAQVLAARETLRVSEQDILLQAATVYMDVVRDHSIMRLREGFVRLMAEQLRATRDRFTVGEVTKTDVAQAQARHALAISQLRAAEATLTASKANFLRVIGQPAQKLSGRSSIESLLPKRLEDAVASGTSNHPQVRGATYGVDVAERAVKVSESALYPTLTGSASVNRRYDATGYDMIDTASVVGRVTIPLYDAGENQSKVRQSKEQLGQRRIEVDAVRDQVRNLVVANWGAHQAVKAQVIAAQAQISASTIALNGIRDEAKVGQRTTLDVLNAQQELLDAQVSLVRIEHDRVVSAYTVLGAIGRLNADTLKLRVAVHDPALHYNQTRDRWGGIRTPSGD